MNYAELVVQIEDTTENTYSTVDIDSIIKRTEQLIYNTVQLSSLRKNVVGTLTTGNKYLSAPGDFLSTYSLAVIKPNGDYLYLLNKDVNWIREAYPNPNTTALPKYYAIFGPTTTNSVPPVITDELSFIVGPTPDDAYDVELHYFYLPESIVDAGTSWLGDNFDSVLLNGCLVEAARFMKAEPDIIQNYDKLYLQSMALLKQLGDGKQRMDAYRDGQVRDKVS
jgi:hypothetical protein